MSGAGKLVPIPVLEIKQMMGRAGRPKYDSVGEAVLLAKNQSNKDYIFDQYIFQDTEPIYSKLSVESALRTHILATVATDIVNSEDGLHKFLNNTFFAYQESVLSIDEKLNMTLDFLNHEGFIKTGKRTSSGDRKISATEFGRRTTKLYIDPLSAVKIKESLSKSETVTLTPLSFLHAISSTPDMLNLYLRSGDYGWIQNIVTNHPEEFLLPVPEDQNDYEWFLSEVKTAMLIVDWIQELPEDQIIAKYFVGPGDIYNKIDTAEWLLYSMRELARLFGFRYTRALNELIQRVRYGVKKDLLDLTNLKGIGRVRARSLAQAGYRKTKDIVGVDVNKLAQVPTIGKRIATDIKLQLGEKVSGYKETKKVKDEDIEGQKLLSDYN
jgi:helicase